MKEEEESDMLHAYDVYFKTVQMRFKDIFTEDFWKRKFLGGFHGIAGCEQENR